MTVYKITKETVVTETFEVDVKDPNEAMRQLFNLDNYSKAEKVSNSKVTQYKLGEVEE